MHYILSASSVSLQNSFNHKGFSGNLKIPGAGDMVNHPKYSELIDAGALRRMSEIARMSVACSKLCIQKSGVSDPEAIIVGSGLGCLYDTEKFLKNIVELSDQLMPPTPFIQSTHNTVAGQLSLVLNNHNYNITHSQNSLSFEMALQNAMMCLNEGKDAVLTGAADEYIPSLGAYARELGFPDLRLNSGASFFMLAGNKRREPAIAVKELFTHSGKAEPADVLHRFLAQHDIRIDDIDLVLYTSSDQAHANTFTKIFGNRPLADYSLFCGMYLTSSAFAFHLAADMLEQGHARTGDANTETIQVKRILVFNNLLVSNFGLMLLESCET